MIGIDAEDARPDTPGPAHPHPYGGLSQDAPPPARPPAPYKVLRVIDGDTVVLMMGSKPTTVRLIGVETPETVDPRKPVERYGREATRFLEQLIAGKSVRLAYDP